MKFIGVLALGIILGACSLSPEKIAQAQNDFQNRLPSGCTFHDLGEYLDVRRVIMIKCTNRNTTSISTEAQNGKYTNSEFAVTIE